MFKISSLSQFLFVSFYVYSSSPSFASYFFFFFHIFSFFLPDICIPCIVLGSKNWQMCQKTAHSNFSVQIQLTNILNLEQLKMGHILQKGTWQSILWISLWLQNFHVVPSASNFMYSCVTTIGNLFKKEKKSGFFYRGYNNALWNAVQIMKCYRTV